MLGLIVLFILIDLATSKLEVLRTDELRAPKCVDCEGIQSQCTVYRGGHFCVSRADRNLIQKNRTYMSSTEKVLDDCIPDHYNVIGDLFQFSNYINTIVLLNVGPIMDYCCIWTPENGCQQLAGHLYQKHSDWKEACDVCLTVCDCEEFRKLSTGVRLTSSMKRLLLVVVLALLWYWNFSGTWLVNRCFAYRRKFNKVACMREFQVPGRRP